MKTTTPIHANSLFHKYLYSNDIEFIVENVFANLKNLQLLQVKRAKIIKLHEKVLDSDNIAIVGHLTKNTMIY